VLGGGWDGRDGEGVCVDWEVRLGFVGKGVCDVYEI
jgi:hypothetical protein